METMKVFILVLIAFLAGNLIPYLILAGNMQTSLSDLTTSAGDQREMLNKILEISQRRGSSGSPGSQVETAGSDGFVMKYVYFDAILSMLVDTNIVTKKTMKNDVVRHVQVTNETAWFWPLIYPGKGGWEEETFTYLRSFLRPTDTYLDFGAWVGPTVLYAANYAKRVIALEPDPAAFKIAARNIGLNPDVAAKTSLYPYCISSKSGKVNMTGVPGASMSRIDGVAGGKNNNTITWTVECFTMEDLLSKLNVEKLDMIKIDTEGAEAFIIPAIKDFLLKQKPTLYLSFHSLNEKQMQQIRPILAKYKHQFDEFGKQVDVNTFNCGRCAVLITDREDVEFTI